MGVVELRDRDVIAEFKVDDRCRKLYESYKEEAIRSLAVLENPSLKGLLRRVITLAFSDMVMATGLGAIDLQGRQVELAGKLEHPLIARVLVDHHLIRHHAARIRREADELGAVDLRHDDDPAAAERLANYLLNLQARQGEHIQLPLNQRQLAAHLGIRAETLSRLFTDWQARGYVSGKRSDWQVHDQAHLRRLASPAQRSF